MYLNTFIAGYRRPISLITLSDRREIVELLKCHSFKITIPEITQFAEGLESLGVLDYMKKYPDIMRELFVYHTPSLTAGTLYNTSV